MTEINLLGEAHTSKKDNNLLRVYCESGIDALFIENREDEGCFNKHKKGFFHRIFLLAVALWYGFLLYFQDEQFIPELNEKGGYEVHKIDATVTDIYGKIKWWEKLLSILFILTISILLLRPIVVIYPVSKIVSFIFCVYVFIISCLCFIVYFFGTMLFLTLDYRNRYMATEVTEKLKGKNYSKVVISCGMYHVHGIKNYLDKQGYNAKIDKTNISKKTERCLKIFSLFIRHPRMVLILLLILSIALHLIYRLW